MVDFENEKAQPPNFENRKCRDVFWCLLFVVFLGGMFCVLGVAVSQGDYKRVTSGMDYRGCICGTKMEYNSATKECVDDSSAPELGSKTVFVQMLDTNTWGMGLYVMCAASCPSVDFQLLCRYDSAPNGVLAGTGDSISAQYDSIVNSAAGQANGCTNSMCSWITDNCARTYKATSTFNYCIPSDNSTFVSFADEFVDSEMWTTAFSSVEKSAWIMFACVVVSCIIAFVYMKVLEHFAKCLTFTAIGLILVALVASGLFLLNAANNIKATYVGSNSNGYWDDINFQMDFYGGIALLIIGGIYLILMCCMCKKILIAIKCVEMASDAVGDTPTIVLIPFVLGLVGILTFVVWCVTAVLLFSAGDVVAADPPTDLVPNGLYKKFEFNRELQYAAMYHLFGLFWTTQFISAFGELCMAYVVVRWFFAERNNGQRQLPGTPVLTAWKNTMKHHMGSIAFGSLIIAVIKMVRAILEYIQRKAGGSKNKLVKLMLCCCRCCLCCVEKCMKFINNQAYIQIALTGDSFCDSAKRAFWLVFRNLGEVGAMKLTATLFVLLGKLVIMGFSTMLCFLILTQVSTFSDQSKDTAVANAFIPSVLVALITYFIGAGFMSVYSQTIETVLMCFIHDKEATGGQFTDEKLRGQVGTMKSADNERTSLQNNPASGVSQPVSLA